ncbi:MAG: type II toxin-antitoxin system VapC family toxin [Elainellaceae cyanobacterium]
MIVVPDSNIFISQVIPLAYSEAADTKLKEWLQADVELVVPSLWSYEIVSAIRKAMTAGLLTQDQAQQSIATIFSLNIKEIPPTPELHQRALDWAIQLQQTVAYDAAFLALTESIGAEFWTADQRLYNACKKLEIRWVNHLA